MNERVWRIVTSLLAETCLRRSYSVLSALSGRDYGSSWFHGAQVRSVSRVDSTCL